MRAVGGDGRLLRRVTREEIALQHDLAGKAALVTGGSRGIGAAVARALAGAGANVAITYLSSRQAAESVAAELRAKGVRARTPAGRAQLRERVQVEHALAHVGHWQGRRARYGCMLGERD
jgi:NAD(P)-dependent dehydrogenase (short-subunit alcohol dehydrogenase family)